MPAFDQVSIRAARMLLRPLTESDAEPLFAVYSDVRVSRYLSKPAWTSIEQAHESIARDREALPSGKYLRLGLVVDGVKGLVGECSFFNLVEQCRRAEVGYAMAFDSWGNGFMHEGLSALLTYGFNELNLNRVEADIDPRNRPSARSLERLGFRNEGRLRERWIVNGEVSDTDLYGLLKAEWHALRASDA